MPAVRLANRENIPGHGSAIHQLHNTVERNVREAPWVKESVTIMSHVQVNYAENYLSESLLVFIILRGLSLYPKFTFERNKDTDNIYEWMPLFMHMATHFLRRRSNFTEYLRVFSFLCVKVKFGFLILSPRPSKKYSEVDEGD